MEIEIEKYLVGKVEALGGWCVKNSCTHQKGFPDRTAVLPGKVIFFEIKDYGRKASLAQRICINKLRLLRQSAYVVDSEKAIDDVLLKEYGNGIRPPFVPKKSD